VVVGQCAPENVLMQMDPDEPNESEFEEVVAKALTCVYPAYRCGRLFGHFRHGARRYRPDLALIARDFSHWFIVEVELASHSLEGHVLPQVKAFQYGEPEPDCISAVSSTFGMSAAQAETLVRFVPRGAAVVANRRDGKWEATLRAHGVQLVTVASFVGQGTTRAVEVEGHLEVVAESLGFGTYRAVDRSICFGRTIRLPDGEVRVEDPDGSAAVWTVRRSGEFTWVTKTTGVPSIPHESYVQIVRTVGGRLSLRRPDA
jgi:hypothetical protein